MNLIMFWLTTVGTSVAMDIYSSFKSYKDYANLGYKYNFGKISELSDELKKNNMMNDPKILLIPIANIAKELISAYQYGQNFEQHVNEMIDLGLLVEMTEDEKKAYEAKKTGFNAFKIAFKYKIDLLKAYTVTFANNSKISFIITDKNDINILKALGQANELSLEEQQVIVTMTLMLYQLQSKGTKVDGFTKEDRNFVISGVDALKVLEESGMYDKIFKKEPEKETTKNININMDEYVNSAVTDDGVSMPQQDDGIISDSEISTEQKISDLKNFKEEIIESKTESNNKKIFDNETGYTRIKRRKH